MTKAQQGKAISVICFLVGMLFGFMGDLQTGLLFIAFGMVLNEYRKV